MVPRKVNIHGKRNRTKIKSKMNKEKNPTKSVKKTKRNGKNVEDTNLHLNLSETESLKKSVPVWLQNAPYNIKMTPQSSVTNTYIDDQLPQKLLEEDFSDTAISEECNCDNLDNNQIGILKQKTSSSFVASYIKSGMDQVASFIVESAIKFGEQHGVIVPDKNNPNIYEFAPTDHKFGEKIKKIRFKIPKKPSDSDNSENRFRRSRKSIEIMGMRGSPEDWRSQNSSKGSQMESRSESLDTIIPILEKLKEKEGMEKTESDNDDTYENWSRKRMNDGRCLRKRLRKSVESINNKESDYSVQGMKGKKFRRDSIELGRRRLRATNCSRKDRSTSVTLS